MIIELRGKGILCDVFYVAATEFERIVSEYGETGIESKVRAKCDESISVSRGFFFDGIYNYPIKLNFPNHEISIDFYFFSMNSIPSRDEPNVSSHVSPCHHPRTRCRTCHHRAPS